MAGRGATRERAPWRFRDLLLVLLVGALLSPLFIVLLTLGVVALISLTLVGTPFSISILFGAAASAAYLALGFAVWLMIVLRRRVPWRAIGLRPVKPGLLLAMIPAGFGLLIVNLLLILPLTFVLGLGDEDRAASQEAMFRPENGLSPVEIVCLAIPLAILAPIVEEVLFRGLLYRYLRGRLGIVAGVLLSALIFAVLHAIIPPLFVMGIVLAILAERSGSILPGIVLHATNNALVVVAIWLTSATQ